MPQSRFCFVVLAVLATLVVATSAPAVADDLALILDASGSMWGQIDGENKIVIARRAIETVVTGLPDDATIGLVAYGHRREGDCDDIETVVPMGPLDRVAFQTTVNALNPKGKTPITKAVTQTLDAVRERDTSTTVILVSDGLETCGGDPCAAVRAAREAGATFVLHVIGFDVAGEDVSQLECAAQAGNGLYRSATDAEELSAALDAALALPADVPPSRLSVHAVANGALHDVAIVITDAATGEDIAGSRTYTSPETNPRLVPVPTGTFDVVVTAVGLQGDIVRRFDDVVVADGETIEKRVDFTAGELSVGVTRNDALSDATVTVFLAGTDQRVAGGRTYNHEKNNPRVLRLTAGRYDVEIGSTEIAGKPTQRFEGIDVPPAGRVERQHAFTSGQLRIGARRGETLVDAIVRIRRLEDNSEIGAGRTYTSAKSNPKTFVLPPGDYRVELEELRGEARTFDVAVPARGELERMVDLEAD